jgi:phytoene dehydrogenase-like protein
VATTFKPPATQRVYDVCVLGGGVGGAAAGALLSRRGFRVLLIDDGAGGSTHADGGWSFPLAPSLLPSFHALPAAEALLAELGLASDAGRGQAPLSPDLQLLLPRHRLTLDRDRRALLGELAREWPAEAARLGSALETLAGAAAQGGLMLKAAPPLPPDGFFERRAVAKALRLAAREAGSERVSLESDPLAPLGDHPLAGALRALVHFLGRLDAPPSPLVLGRLAGVALGGLHHPLAGLTGLEEPLRRRITETRGEVLGSADAPALVESLQLDGRRLTTVRVSGMTDAWLARAFVVASPLRRVAERLPAGAAGKRVERALARLGTGRRLVARHLVLQGAARPPGLGDAAIWLDGMSPAESAVLLTLGPAHHAARPRAPASPPGTELLASAWTLSPAGEVATTAEARLAAALAQALPFHERHHLHRFSPPPHPWLGTVAGDPLHGLAGLPVRTPWKNAFLASGEVLPALGLEGELYAGLQAAAYVGALLGRKSRPR